MILPQSLQPPIPEVLGWLGMGAGGLMWLLLGIQKLRIIKGNGHTQHSAEARHKELLEKMDEVCNVLQYELPNKLREQWRDDIADALIVAKAKDVLRYRSGDTSGPDFGGGR